MLLNVQCKGQRTDNNSDGKSKELKSFSWKITQDNQIYCFKPYVNIIDTASEILTIDVMEVKNENLIPVYVNVFFRTSDSSISIGNFTLYPPDKPSVFKFRISEVIGDLNKNVNFTEIREVCFIYFIESELNAVKESFIELNIAVRKEN